MILDGERIFRAVFAPQAPYPETWSHDGPLADLVVSGKFLAVRPVPCAEVPARIAALAPGAIGFIEQPCLEVITFPYEWPFELLKRAALLHLELHRKLLERGFSFADGSAYNLQFDGTRPMFIDSLAVERYADGAPWAGYTQFCEQFLNPLLLAARGNTAWLDMYRGRMRGVSTNETARQLGLAGALRAGVFMHVTLHAMAARGAATGSATRSQKISRAGLDLMLRSLTRAVTRLRLPARGSGWGGYEASNSYAHEQRGEKHAAVRTFVECARPRMLLDIGCNAGEYSELALDAGAGFVVGLERDGAALSEAVARADRLKSFLPLQVDILNPSPSQGWDLAERQSLRDRLKPDAVLCLALLHHLVLGEGVPLDVAVPGIVKWAPRGVIEFVPREDPMAARIAGPPERLTHAYDLPAFLATLARCATVERQWNLTASGRVLVEYSRPS